MSQWMRVQKGDLELDVLYHNREVRVTTAALGVCSRSKDAILARSYEIMTQLIFSNTALLGREREAMEAFFMRNGFTILHTLHL